MYEYINLKNKDVFNMKYNYIIVGLAQLEVLLLRNYPKFENKVLVVEAGLKDNSIWDRIPIGMGKFLF